MTKKIILSVLYIVLFLPLTGFCGVKYFEKSDDFSDGITYGLSIPSYKGNNGDLGINTGMIVVACVPERGLIAKSYTLIIRFNKTGDVLKFSLKDTAKHIQKILNKCSKKNPSN
jgi:hypothetical protein